MDMYQYKNSLIVVSEKRICKIKMSQFPENIDVSKIWDYDQTKVDSSTIEYSYYLEKHKKLYWLFKDEETRTNKIFTYDLETKQVLYYETKFWMLSFVMDTNDPELMFLISDKFVYKLSVRNLQTNEEGEFKIFTKNDLEVYHKSTHIINYFKFDHEMKHFYLNGFDKIYKYTYSEKPVLVETFANNVRCGDFALSKDNSLFIR